MQIERMGPIPQMLPVSRPQHNAAAGREHTGSDLRQLGNDLLFKVAKRRLPFALEKFPDRAANTLLNKLIRIEKFEIKPTGKLPADGGFA